MLHNFKNTLLFVGTSALLFTGCGDDDPKTTPDATAAVDASTTDAAEEIDAGPDTTFSGTLSLAEVTVTGPVAASLGGLGGGTVNVGFVSPSDVTVAPQPGYTNNIGGCRIFVYDVAAGDAAPAGSDGGPVTVTGTNSGEFACNYNGALDTYLCASTATEASGAVTAAGSSATLGPSPGTVLVTLGGVDLGAFDPTGGSIILSDFVDPAANGRFSVLAKQSANSVLVANPALMATSGLAQDSTYSTLVGTGPQPGGFDFLDDGTAQNVFTKAAATDAPEINTMLQANGQGFALDAATSSMPHAIPTDGTAVTFSCDSDDDPMNANDTCGVDTGNPLKGMLIFGETTDGVLNPADPFGMPEAVSKYATFQCSAIGMKKFALDEGAMALILGTDPTRIQTSIVYSSAALAGPNNLVVSHGVVGFTDVPQTKK